MPKDYTEYDVQETAKKVLISAPAKDHDVTIVYGVNNKMLKKEYKIISAASCTTNCVANMIKILHDSFKIESGFFVTTHAYTSTQRLIDGVDKKDVRRGRAAAIDIVPSTTGAATAVVETIPELKGKLYGYALRVPVANGSFVTIVVKVEKKTTEKEINNIFKKKAHEMKNVLEYTEEPLVSADIIHNPNSCIIDGNFTHVIDDLITTAGWYDNEWGYSSRLVDVARLILGK